MKHYDIYTKKWHWIKILFFSFMLIALANQCEIQKDFDYEYCNIDGNLNVTAWEFIQQQDSLSLMEEAITMTRLNDYFSGETAYTFIVPSNKAWRNYLSSNGYNQISEVPLPILKNVLLYHIITEKILFTDPKFYASNTPVAFLTKNGQQMYLSRDNRYKGVINYNTNKSWIITTSNLEPNNGTINISTSVVYYSAKTGNTDIPDASIESDTIYAINDAFINGGAKKNVNFGSDKLLRIKNVDGSGDYDRKAYLMFDLKDVNLKGRLREAFINISIKFTHGKSLRMSLYNVPDTTWSETSLTWNNAPTADTSEISHLITSKTSTFTWDCTNYIAEKMETQERISIMIDGEAGGNETNDLSSKENTSLAHPMLITTYSSGNSKLKYGTNAGITVANQGSVVLSNTHLEMKGAKDVDIIYTLNAAPTSGWLITGTEILRKGSKFSQLDININNIVYIHSGAVTSDKFTVSVQDKDGGDIAPFDVIINIK